MAQSIARDAEAFARLLFQTVEQLGESGDWVPGRDAVARTMADHPEHPYVADVRAKPGRRSALSAAAERIRTAEFAHIERRKAGTRQNAPVFYRVGRAPLTLELHLPFAAAPSHPLVSGRRAAAASGSGPSPSLRRTALTTSEPKSPWRRRLLGRHGTLGTAARTAPRLWHQRWRRLRAQLDALVMRLRER